MGRRGEGAGVDGGGGGGVGVKQLNGFNMWVFRGSETTGEERRAKLLFGDSWYVGYAPGSKIAAGPFDSEELAVSNAREMTDSRGT